MTEPLLPLHHSALHRRIFRWKQKLIKDCFVCFHLHPFALGEPEAHGLLVRLDVRLASEGQALLSALDSFVVHVQEDVDAGKRDAGKTQE